MCGIVGLISSNSAGELDIIVHRMNDQIIHRGPDDSGCWYDDRVAMAMRRLSILDLEGGHQPMIANDGVVIVFNGEIYNHKNLRADLTANGFEFNTRSDTEIILQLYRHGGIDALTKLEGMFAIAIFDPSIGKLHLIRDRIGIKPLYYAFIQGQFYFSSEIKSIIAATQKKPGINDTALFDFLTLRYVPHGQTIWRDIWKLDPGHYITYDINDNTYIKTRYWSIDI